MSDPVNHPTHYNQHPSGVECIEIAQAMSFLTGNAFKYAFRHRYSRHPLRDLRKARWCIDRQAQAWEDADPVGYDARRMRSYQEWDDAGVPIGKLLSYEAEDSILEAVWCFSIVRDSESLRKARHCIDDAITHHFDSEADI